MSSLFRRKPLTVRRGLKTLHTLETELAYKYRKTLILLEDGGKDPSIIAALGSILQLLAEMVKIVHGAMTDLDEGQLAVVHKQLSTWTRKVVSKLQSELDLHIRSRRLLIELMQLLIQAEEEFILLCNIEGNADSSDRIGELVISTDLLFQCYQSLFPPERMLVIAGRARNNRLELGATFDVTGQASTGHVRADSRKLGQALIAMSATDTHLAAWFHSHPGNGTRCTYPSGTDLKQHRDWLKDFSESLVSGIFVQDRFFRLWGSALEEREIQIVFVGTGIVQVNGEQHVYKIVPG
ncbi:hypothetical protein FBQ87_14445 [Sphingobacteriales bacterium CHB3]|nr:hypothetical protein [Sphingobacteriales bacterium CHB3]